MLKCFIGKVNDIVWSLWKHKAVLIERTTTSDCSRTKTGDGTLTDDLTAIKKTYTFAGLYDAADPGMAFIATKEFTLGEARKIAFRQVRTDGSELFGKATVTAIKVTGGDASDYAPFECAISWDQIPTVTPPPSNGG